MQLAVGKETPHLFTATEYMTLETQHRTELLGGVVYDVSPRREPHRHAVRKLVEALAHGLFGSAYIVQSQDAVAVPDWQGIEAPEIDVAVLQRKEYDPGPTSCDAVAFVEVSDTTYAVDRNYKTPLYVNAGVASWIVNIPLRQVEFYGSRQDLERKHGHVFTDGDTIDILGIVIPVRELFLKKADTDRS